MKITRILFYAFLLIGLSFGCKSDTKRPAPTKDASPTQIRNVPKFDENNAYNLVQKQVDFGYRWPGTKAHGQLVEFLADELGKYTDDLIRQEFKVDFLDEKNVTATNIIGVVNPEYKKRILLCAHFDTRKIAEKDDDPNLQNDPILGADDGGSGVGVLLEIARLIKENGIDIGVDFVLFDAEDNGTDGQGWCLGSKYWGKNPHVSNYKAQFGILLDMVGAKNAVFNKEGNSYQSAGKELNKIWKLAQAIGYGNYFQDKVMGGIEDDHVHVMRHRQFPVVDIINIPNEDGESVFGHYHHTHKDNMDIIDKNTLKAVGKVVTAVVYNFSNRRF